MKLLFILVFASLNNLVFAQAAGALDPSFGREGKVINSVGESDAKAYGVAVQDDGSFRIAISKDLIGSNE